MGWLTGSGSLARVVGPLYVTAVYAQGGIRWTSVSVLVLLVMTLALLGKFWKRLVPYEDRFKSKAKLYNEEA